MSNSKAIRHNTIAASPKGVVSWNDYEAIRQIVAGYCHIVDRAVAVGETPDTSELYHPQAQYSNSFEEGEVQVGHDAVVAWYHRFLGKRSSFYRYMRHKVFESAIVISADGETAEVSTYYDAESLDRNNQIRAITGIYQDSMAKHEGRWVIIRRHVMVHYHFNQGEAHRYIGWGRKEPGSNDGWNGPVK
ncbi:MAG: nuclear transport factor 2 family protein [Burkholderiaceae bacterium]|nr:nuclear transport factor 2 family protein [Burkholderiaceae bacterium]